MHFIFRSKIQLDHPVQQGASRGFELQADATYPHGLQRGVLVLVARRITVGIAARPGGGREKDIKQILILLGSRKKMFSGFCKNPVLQKKKVPREHYPSPSGRARAFLAISDSEITPAQ